MNIRLLSLAFSLFFTSVNCGAQDMEEILDGILSDYNLVGMAAGVACEGEILETYFGGQAVLDNDIPITASTQYRIASISKAFTAVGLLQLIGQGLADLDDDISTALGYTVENPAFPGVAITYRMLLSHTSSLQDGSGYADFLGATIGDNPMPNISEVLLPGGNFFSANMWRTESPGSHFAYSNINYGLVGTLIEALSGQRFDVYMRDQVLIPMGMEASFNIDDIAQIDLVATLYRNSAPQLDDFGGVAPPPFDGSGYVPGTNGARFGPQGSLRCSLPDLLTFGKMLYKHGMHEGQSILDSALVAEMLMPQWTYAGGNGDNYFGLFQSWGLGIHRALGGPDGDAVFAGIEMLGHPGEAYGLISDLYFDPLTGFVLAFVTNGYLSGGNYELGQNSTFYRIEEEVFETVYSAYWDACAQSLSTGTRSSHARLCKEVFFDQDSGLLRSRAENHKQTQIEVRGISGHLLKTEDFSGAMHLDDLKAGLYIVSLVSDEGACALKIVTGIR